MKLLEEMVWILSELSYTVYKEFRNLSNPLDTITWNILPTGIYYIVGCRYIMIIL